MNDSVDSVPFKINEGSLWRICNKHEIPFDDVLAPSRDQKAHDPPEGYIACNRYVPDGLRPVI